MHHRPIVGLGLLLAAAGSAVAADGFKDHPGSHLDILHNGKPLVRYMYAYDLSSPQRRVESYKPWHHVLDPAGKDVITKGSGGKFTHHRAIYIGWSKLAHGGKSHDLWHMKSKAAQVHKGFLKQEAGPQRSVLSSRIHWLTTDGATLAIDEVRTVTVHHGDKKAHLLLDFETELKAVNGDVHLKGDPEHAGFQYRPHNDVVKNKSARYTFHGDGIKATKDKDLPWVAMTYQLRGQKYTVQHMNHPSNPKGTRYSAYRDYGRFGAFFEKPIKDGDALKLKYRIRVTLGDAPERAALAKQYDSYVGG